MSDSQSALSGITVVDVSGGMAAALASMLLADNGARVIRVALRDEDVIRKRGIFAVYDRGKEVVRLDADDPGSKAALLDLRAGADVVVDDLAPSSSLRELLGIDRLGRLRDVGDALVHCSITAYGTRGPLRDEPADHDLVAARMGILGSQPSYRGGAVYVAHPVAYVGAALLACMGICAALYRRERTGVGARVETSLMAGALLYTPKAVSDSLPPRPMNMTPQGGGPFYSVFECADGEWIQIGCIHSGFVDLAAAVIGVAEAIATDPEFGDGRWPRTESARKRLFDMVADKLRSRPSAEWIAELRAADVPCDVVRSAEEAMSDAQILHNELVQEVEDPLLGRTRMMGLPIALSETPGRVEVRKEGARKEKRGERKERDAQPTDILKSSAGGNHPHPNLPLSRGKGLARRDLIQVRALEESMQADALSPHSSFLFPLKGVRIMEMTNVIAGPVAGRLLADLGADMVKFESLDGDISRPAGGAGFVAFNTNKRSVSVNTKTDDGKEVARRLAATSDAILANMRPGATDRMGLDSETLAKLNPRLIESHITAYGWDGPYSQRPGVDPIAQAITGLQRAQGGYEGPPVYLSALAPCDYTGGALGALGTVLALLARERAGVAQRVNTNLLAAGVVMCADGFLSYEGKPPRPLPDKDQFGVGPLRRVYRALDGWVMVGGFIGDRSEELGDRDEKGLEGLVGGMTVGDALGTLGELGLAAVPVVENYGAGFFDDPQAEAARMATTLEHPTLGAVNLSGNLVSFDGVDTLPVRPTPLLGEHTWETLAELGYSAERIADLHARGVVKSGD